MKVKLLGGCQIGASSAENIFLDDTGQARHVIFDSGAQMGNNNSLEELGHILPQRVDAIVISHAHRDHVGFLPWLMMKNFPQAEALYMSRPTTYLTRIGWEDSYSIFKREARKDFKNNWLLDAFSQGIERASQILNIIEEPGRTEIFPGIFMTVGSSGHLSGAMWAMFEAEGKAILYTGDISFQNRPTVNGTILTEFPKRKIDAFFMDSTCGDKEIPVLLAEEKRMLEDIKKAIDKNRNVFVAALSRGRLPDVALFLAQNGIDIFSDGSGNVVLDETLGPDGHWSDHEPEIDFSEDDSRYAGANFATYFLKSGGKIRKIESPGQRGKVLNSGEPKVIIAPSGMLTGGWSVRYTSYFLEDPTALVCLTSYQAEDTPGRELKEKKEKKGFLHLKNADGKKIKVEINAQIGDYNLSSHAGASELVKMVKYLNPDKTFLVHGDDNGRTALKAKLAENAYFNTFIPQNGDEIVL